MSTGKHDKLQAEAYQWAHDTFPQIRGHLFAARSEVIKYPGESEQAYMARMMHLKAIGHRKGILDLHLDMPATNIRPGAPYEFDAKIKPDYLKPAQLDRIEMMRKCGGNGWAFFSFEEFQRIFEDVMLLHFGEFVLRADKNHCGPWAIEANKELERQRQQKRDWINEMRKSI